MEYNKPNNKTRAWRTRRPLVAKHYGLASGVLGKAHAGIVEVVVVEGGKLGLHQRPDAPVQVRSQRVAVDLGVHRFQLPCRRLISLKKKKKKERKKRKREEK